MHLKTYQLCRKDFTVVNIEIQNKTENLNIRNTLPT